MKTLVNPGAEVNVIGIVRTKISMYSLILFYAKTSEPTLMKCDLQLANTLELHKSCLVELVFLFILIHFNADGFM